jgi:hypothetical protein
VTTAGEASNLGTNVGVKWAVGHPDDPGRTLNLRMDSGDFTAQRTCKLNH